nr:serine/threonine-protein kinase [Calothrix sp. MO_167.B42]
MKVLAGRYQIIRKLGEGGFGFTFLAKDILQPSKPNCVVKQLRPHYIHPRIIKFFEKEAAILEKLGKHPQIPQLLANFKENQNLYIVQEFIEGYNLSEELLPGKQLTEAYVVNFLQEVLEILSFVHRYGVIHRDIKPDNLIRRIRDDKIFLIDFGAVKELENLTVNPLGEVSSSIIIGTRGYMSPEQGLGKACLASDIYALGMTAIQALTGILPSQLEESSTGEVIWRNHVKISDSLAIILTKMVCRNHHERYNDAAVVLQDLISSQAKSSRLKTVSSPQTKAKWSRRRLIRASGLVTTGFAAAL